MHLSAPDIDPKEMTYFEGLAHRWWDDQGPFWPLHRLNAFRVEYLRRNLARLFGRDPSGPEPLAGLNLLDIGCGGGILSESMARLGAQVTGIEVAEKNVRVSRLHADWSGLAIDYQLTTVDALANQGETFDVVLNMEVVEHVEQLPEFLASCARLVRPGGVLVIATINRTLLAWLTAIVGAEYLLRWLPKGTHHYRKLVRPGEVLAALGTGFQVIDRTGVRVSPLTRAFSFSRSLAVNYMLVLQRDGGLAR